MTVIKLWEPMGAMLTQSTPVLCEIAFRPFFVYLKYIFAIYDDNNIWFDFF